MYLDCRLKFYLQYLANIQEKDEVKEEIDAAVFGNIAHYSMEFLYDGFRKRKNRDFLEKEDFEDLRKNWVFPSIELGVRKFYHLEENADTKLSGQMAIVRDVMQKYMVRLLEIDEEDAPFRLVSMEKAHKAQFEINTANPCQPRQGFVEQGRRRRICNDVGLATDRTRRILAGLEAKQM